MKKTLPAALALAALAAPVLTSGTAAAAWSSGTAIHIESRTSTIFLFDPSGDETSYVPAVTAPATVVRCEPFETYQMEGSLRQNGVTHPWASRGGMGAGEYWCDETGRIELGNLPFIGEDLRPGRARVVYSLRLCCDGDQIPEATASRVVRIPRG